MEAAHLLKSQAALKVDPSHKKKKKNTVVLHQDYSIEKSGRAI